MYSRFVCDTRPSNSCGLRKNAYSIVAVVLHAIDASWACIGGLLAVVCSCRGDRLTWWCRGYRARLARWGRWFESGSEKLFLQLFPVDDRNVGRLTWLLLSVSPQLVALALPRARKIAFAALSGRPRDPPGKCLEAGLRGRKRSLTKRVV